VYQKPTKSVPLIEQLLVSMSEFIYIELNFGTILRYDGVAQVKRLLAL
jgi:hypothetical protein